MWTLVLTGLLCTATTANRSAGGHTHTRSVDSPDPVGVAAFVAVGAVAVTGSGFLLRVRAGSGAPSRADYVVAGLLGVLGVLSPASIGLA